MYNPPLAWGIRKKMRKQNMFFNHRKWNILAFRGRLMSLLAPARGMSTLPAKGGFSRPSSFTHSGVSPRPHLPQDKEGYSSDASHAEKAGFFFKESRIFHLLGWAFILNGFSRVIFINVLLIIIRTIG